MAFKLLVAAGKMAAKAYKKSKAKKAKTKKTKEPAKSKAVTKTPKPAPKSKAVAKTPKAKGKEVKVKSKSVKENVGIPVRKEKVVGSGSGEKVKCKAISGPAKKKKGNKAAKAGAVAAGLAAIGAVAATKSEDEKAPAKGETKSGEKKVQRVKAGSGKVDRSTAPKKAKPAAKKAKPAAKKAKAPAKKKEPSSFGKAFSKAHDSGADTFMWKGELKNTKRADGSETKARKAAKAKASKPAPKKAKTAPKKAKTAPKDDTGGIRYRY